MNEARRERVRELIRSLESVRLRRQARCEKVSAFEGRPTSSNADWSRQDSPDAAHSPCEDRGDIQSAIGHRKFTVGDDDPPEPKPAPIAAAPGKAIRRVRSRD